MQELKALRPLVGDWGTVRPGMTFRTDEKQAEDLEARGLAARLRKPSMFAKMTGPAENKMAEVSENKGVTLTRKRFSK